MSIWTIQEDAHGITFVGHPQKFYQSEDILDFIFDNPLAPNYGKSKVQIPITVYNKSQKYNSLYWSKLLA